MKEYTNLKGSFRMKTWKQVNGVLFLQEEFEDLNKIVTLGKTTLCKLMANDGVSNYVNKIGFGTGSNNPTIADEDLTNLYARTVDSYSYPTSTSIKYVWTLGLTENNDVSITEYGLLSNDETLFSRIIRTAKAKESDIILTGDWTIEFL